MSRFDSYKETELEIKNQAQKQQIEKMSLRINQLEEQYKSKEAHMMSKIQQLLHVEEMARGLCQKILDKDRREIVLGSNHSWGKVTSEEMIETAMKSYRQYCEKRTKDMQKLGEYACDLNEKNEQLTKEVNELKNAIEEAEKSESLSSGRKKEISGRFNKSKIGDIEIECETEEEDEEEDNSKAEKTTESTVKKAPAKKIPSMAQQSMENTVRLLLPTLTDTEKKIIELVGDGMSVSVEIKKAMVNSAGKSTSHNYMRGLALDKGLLDYRDDVNFPGTKNVTLYRLSAKGKIAYRIITGNEPNESELDRLMRYHATPEHGYGIRACQRLFMRSDRYTDVQMFANEIKLSDGVAYRPDLVCTRYEDGKKIVEYFEYERYKQNVQEYFIKFGKMAMLTDEINVIVESPTSHEKMQRMLANWAKPKKKIPGYPQKMIRLTNYNRIRDCIDNNKPFHDWWYIEDSLRDFKPPIGDVDDPSEGE